ncbi:MAG: hypothetical protein LBQ81_11285 [Zoogloeaceae bacterium]|nr:hypothetical protein [Zoogloeaceae bacterium]
MHFRLETAIVLAHSGEAAAYQYLERVAEFSIHKNPRFLGMMYKFSKLLAQHKPLSDIHNKIGEYYDSVQDKIASYVWAKSIGLKLPKNHEWDIRFSFTTDGALYLGRNERNKASVKEQEKMLELVVHIEAAQFGRTYEIGMQDYTNNIRASFSDTQSITANSDYFGYMEEHGVRLIGEGMPLAHLAKLANLKEFIAYVENRYGVLFARAFSSLYASRGINKKIIQAWIEA